MRKFSKLQSDTRRSFLGKSAAVMGTTAVAGIAAVTAPYVARASSPLRFWTWFDSKDSNPRAQVQRELVEKFQKETGIEVKTEVKDWRTLSQQIVRAVAAGEGPDVTRTYSAWVGEQAAAGTLLPLDPFMAQWPKEKRSDIGPPLPTYDGKTLAMYIENRVWMLYYRADFLKKAGLEVPKTFGEVARAAGAMADSQRAGFIWTASLKSTDTYQYALPMIWALGGQMLRPDKSAAFNEGGAVVFMEWLRDLVLKHKAMPATYIGWDEEQLQQAVNSGTMAMCIMGTNRLASSRARLPEGDAPNLRAAPAPSTDGKPPPVPVTGWCLSLTRSSKQPKEAFRLLDYLTSTEAQVLNARVAGEMPVRLSALQDPWFKQPNAAEMRSWVEYVAKSGREANSLKISKSRELSSLYNTATQEIILRNRPVKQALDEAAAKWNSVKG